MSRTNKVVNPSAKTNTTGWSINGTGTTVSRISSEITSPVGATYFEVTKAAVSDSGIITTSRISTTASTSYAISSYIKVEGGEGDYSYRISVSWYTATSGGSLISTSTTTSTEILSGSGWLRLGGVFTSPSGALGATILISQPIAGTAGKKFKIDGILFEQSTYIGEYFDDTTQSEETAAVNKSLTPLPPPIFTGMKLNADVALGDMVFNTVDENGVVWVITDIKGWWSIPTPIIPDFSRGWGDGSYDVKGRYGPRDLVLEGVFLTPDSSYVPAARQTLSMAADLVHSGAWLRATESGGLIKSSYVRLSGAPEIETVNARGKTTFSIGLRASDPVKYLWDYSRIDGYKSTSIACKSASPSVSGSTTITNQGTYPVSTYLEVTGPVVGPAYIDNTTTLETITISEALRPATTKTITQRGLIGNLATITTSTAHGLVPGDIVTISGVVSTVFNGEQVVLDVIGTPSTSAQFRFEVSGADVTFGSGSGTVAYGPDFLEIDTYNRVVYLNGDYSNARAKLDVYNEWVTLAPGDNTIVFRDDGTPSASTATLNVLYKSGWIV